MAKSVLVRRLASINDSSLEPGKVYIFHKEVTGVVVGLNADPSTRQFTQGRFCEKNPHKGYIFLGKPVDDQKKYIKFALKSIEGIHMHATSCD